MGLTRRVFPIVTLVLVVLPTASAAALENDGLTLSIPTVAQAPPLNGDLTSPIWQQGAKVMLGYDRQTRSASSERTTAYILTDGKAIYVGFDAVQTRVPIVANQRTNNVGVDTDDEVKIALWPGGRSGFNYQFISTPIGTRYQVSSENSNYEPDWDAVAKMGHNEWFVTMRIPLDVVRGAHRDSWLVQFSRWEPTTGSLYLWSGGTNVSGTSDPNYARPLLKMPATVGARPKPRFGVYSLAAIAAPSIGGSTSRMGVDLCDAASRFF
jgi:hypothetical protein